MILLLNTFFFSYDIRTRTHTQYNRRGVYFGVERATHLIVSSLTFRIVQTKTDRTITYY